MHDDDDNGQRRRCAAAATTAATTAIHHRVPLRFDRGLCPLPDARVEKYLKYVRAIADKALSPERIDGTPEYLRSCSREVLVGHLAQVLIGNFATTGFLSKALMVGLVHGGDQINASVALPQVAFPILIWTCQWKTLNKQFLWEGEDEIVQMVLATPGIQVNAVANNGCNAAFLAVKYGSLRTLELLIKAGTDMNQKDCFGRTCLYNALERPSPAMLRCVLSQLPATEMFPRHQHDVAGNLTTVDRVSVADSLFDLFTREVEDDHGGEQFKSPTPLSWQILGPPSVNDVSESLIMVRNAGAEFTNETEWECASAVMQGVLGSRNDDEAEIFKRLVQCALGFWLPPNVQKQVDELSSTNTCDDEPNDEEKSECPICFHTFSKEVTLYCGHTFCRRCIMEHGDRKKTCPLCRRRLCLDVAPQWAGNDSSNNTPIQLRLMSRQLGLDETRPMIQEAFFLSHLTGDQIMEEAKAQGLHSPSDDRDTLQRKLETKSAEAFATRQRTPSGEGVGEAPLTLELSASGTIASKGLLQAAPKKGPGMIEINIKGVPVVASLSNNSLYTCISKSVVDTFRLRRLPNLTSNQFRCMNGKRATGLNFTCLENFTFTVGDCKVSLRNALEVSPAMLDGVGVQLGMDFFLSAAFCAVDVQVGVDSDAFSSYMRFNGWYSWLLTKEEVERSSIQPFSESLRYYSHDGKIAKLRLLHYHELTQHRINTITIKQDTKFSECSWCCRCFPKGMLVCRNCEEEGLEDAHYCDQGCQKAARRIHRFRRRSAHPKEDD